VTGKVVVITGSNGGLGKVVALQMAKRGARVVMACRNPTKTENAVKEIKEKVPDADLTVIPLDLSDLDSVHACAKEITQKFPHVNILINNAGVMLSKPNIQRTAAGFEVHLVTNYLGHVLLTMLLLDHLKLGSPSRIVLLSSMAAEGAKINPEDLNWEKSKSLQFLNFGPYNDSKRLIMLFGRLLAQKLDGTQINVYSLCPGVAETDLVQTFPATVRFFIRLVKIQVGCTAEQGATTIMYCALSEKCAKESGKMYHYEKPWAKANRELDKEEELAGKIWTATEKLLGISFDTYLSKV
jgi:NAD(P)-dependent dehydrogenase (short-subunit alcohol dehydrogenase family)